MEEEETAAGWEVVVVAVADAADGTVGIVVVVVVVEGDGGVAEDAVA